MGLGGLTNPSVLPFLAQMIAITAVIVLVAVIQQAVTAQQQPCVKWGNTFDVSLESANVIRNCNLPDGRKICCAAVSNNTATRGVGASYVPKRSGSIPPNGPKSRASCTVEKHYVSSPQELRELAEAEKIERIPGDKSLYMIEARYHALMEYVTSDDYIRNSTLWLDRVKAHMGGVGPGEGDEETGNVIDKEFLSRFEFTRTCTSTDKGGIAAGSASTTVTKWTEWIEPVGITARHPFGFATCKQSPQYYNAGGSRNKNGKAKPRAGRSNVDYVLLQSGAALHRQTHTSTGRRSKQGSGSAGKEVQVQAPSKHYLFDAGTSTFDSSLFWFTCAFSQVSSLRGLWRVMVVIRLLTRLMPLLIYTVKYLFLTYWLHV